MGSGTFLRYSVFFKYKYYATMDNEKNKVSNIRKLKRRIMKLHFVR